MRIFIDDERFPAAGDHFDYIVRTKKDLLKIDLKNIEYISFDHDFGAGEYTGYDIAKYLVEKDFDTLDVFSTDFDFYVHSQNPVGKNNISSYLKNYLKHRKDRLSKIRKMYFQWNRKSCKQKDLMYIEEILETYSEFYFDSFEFFLCSENMLHFFRKGKMHICETGIIEVEVDYWDDENVKFKIDTKEDLLPHMVHSKLRSKNDENIFLHYPMKKSFKTS